MNLCKKCQQVHLPNNSWYCEDCLRGKPKLALVETAISSLEEKGSKLYDKNILLAIGCLMSLRVLIEDDPI